MKTEGQLKLMFKRNRNINSNFRFQAIFTCNAMMFF